MNIRFNTIRYFHLPDGIINIVFDSSEKTNLTFNGGGFCMSGNQDSRYNNYNLKPHRKWHVINNIKETNDLDFIMQIDEVLFLKILFTPDDTFPNGVIQTFCVYSPSDSLYDAILCDYNEGYDLALSD